MKSVLRRAIAGGAVTATASATFLALIPAAHAAGTPPYEPDQNSAGTITLYDANGHQVTSGKVSDAPIAAYAVGSAIPRVGDTKAALYAAQPAPNTATSDWSVDQLSQFTTFPVSSGPTNVNGQDASHPVVTGSASDMSLQGFITEYPNDPSHQSDASYQNLYQLRLRTANSAGNVSDTYDVMDVLVDAAAGTWTEVYPTNSVDTSPPRVTAITPPKTLNGDAFVTFSESVKGLNASSVRLTVTGSSAVATSVACFNGSTAVACSSTFNKVRLRPLHLLVAGQHYTIVVLAGATHDLAGNASTSASKNFRALQVLEENNSAITTAWQKVSNKSAFGGSFVREHSAGASASWSFTGTSVTLWTVKGRDEGKADLYIDGVKRTTINNYSTTTKFKVARTISKLRSARHTIRVVVRGQKGAKTGTGTFVAVDAFTVGKTRTSTPVLTAAWRTIVKSAFFGGHAMTADLKGEVVTLTFRGTGITWFTMRGKNQGKATVFVDGVKKLAVDDFATSTSYRVKHAVMKLADKVHTLRIVVAGAHHKGGTGNWVTLDRLSVA